MTVYVCVIAMHTDLAVYYFFFNDTATTEIYTLSLHDALPISPSRANWPRQPPRRNSKASSRFDPPAHGIQAEIGSSLRPRSEEHTSELQSQSNLVCRLLLEKKK